MRLYFSLESKKEEKEKSKKEKKEKSKKRESKDLDSHVANDTNVTEIEVGGQEDSASPKTKKKFGIFRLSGRKSKSDKRNSKHGSSDSLKRQSVDSADIESLGSELSLEESTGSAEMSTTITEVSSTSAEVPTTISEVPTVNAEESSTSVIMSTTSAEVAEESNEIVKPQSNSEVSNEIEGQEAVVVETSSEVKIVSAVLPDMPEKEIEQPPSQDTKLAIHTLEVESVSFQEQSPVASELETFQFKLQSSAISSKENKNVKEKEEQHSSTEESRTESVQMVIEEDASTYPKKDFVIAPEVSLEDIKSERDREITSSEDESVDTVVSSEALNTRRVVEISEDIEVGMRGNTGMEEPVISTYQERKGPLQDAAQEYPPIDEDAITLPYENKTQNEISNEQHVQEEPIALASKERREDLVLSEITFREEPVTETEPILLIKNEDMMKTDKAHEEVQVEEPSEAKMEEPSEEELLIPTHIQSKRDNREEEEEEQEEQGEVQEASVYEEAMVLSYPDKDEDQIQNESQDGPKTVEEEPAVLETNENKENQIQEQIQEFLKLDASIDEKSAKESEAVKKDDEVGKTRDSQKENELPKTKEIIEERSEKFRTSTRKKEPVDSEQGEREDTENKKQKPVPPVSYNVTRFKQESVMQFNVKVQMVNNIKDVKLSTKVLMAKLAEVNKKLRMLQKELLEVQKSDGDNNPRKSTQMVSVET